MTPARATPSIHVLDLTAMKWRACLAGAPGESAAAKMPRQVFPRTRQGELHGRALRLAVRPLHLQRIVQVSYFIYFLSTTNNIFCILGSKYRSRLLKRQDRGSNHIHLSKREVCFGRLPKKNQYWGLGLVDGIGSLLGNSRHQKDKALVLGERQIIC